MRAFTPFPDADDTEPARWLVSTPQLDLQEPKLRITAHKLTQAHQTLPARAAAIHAFVRRLPFATDTASGSLRASEVLRRGQGDCHAKGVLFTALCRAAGLPARLLFVAVRTRFLAGLLAGRPEVMPHAVGQVWLHGRWHSTDGYVVDPVLFAHAKSQLRSCALDSGWGLVHDARGVWHGEGDCLHQFHPGDVRRVFGVFHDAASFQALHGGAAHPWRQRLLHALGAQLLNHRVARLRSAFFVAPPAHPGSPS